MPRESNVIIKIFVVFDGLWLISTTASCSETYLIKIFPYESYNVNVCTPGVNGLMTKHVLPRDVAGFDFLVSHIKTAPSWKKLS